MITRTRAASVLAAVGAAVAVGAGPASAALPELAAPPGMPFAAVSKAAVLQTASKVKIKCTADSAKGEVLGPKMLTVTLVLTGCTSSAVPGVLCNSPNGVPGEVATFPLIGQIGYIKSEPPAEVGLDLSDPAAGLITTVICGPSVDNITGSVIGRVTPLNKATKKLVVKFSQKAGIQNPTHLMGGPLDVLESSFGGPPIPTGLAGSEPLVFPAPVALAG